MSLQILNLNFDNDVFDKTQQNFKITANVLGLLKNQILLQIIYSPVFSETRYSFRIVRMYAFNITVFKHEITGIAYYNQNFQQPW